MRIIAGKFKKRTLKMLKCPTTRPTTDKVRESVFNILTPYLEYQNALDLFAGTGAYGFEALSRGYETVSLVDHDLQPYQVILENRKLLAVEDSCSVYKMDYRKALLFFKTHSISFDLVFLDPPYKLNVYEEIISKMQEDQTIRKNGFIVCEVDSKIELHEIEGYTIWKKVNYGIRNIIIYQKG